MYLIIEFCKIYNKFYNHFILTLKKKKKKKKNFFFFIYKSLKFYLIIF